MFWLLVIPLASFLTGALMLLSSYMFFVRAGYTEYNYFSYQRINENGKTLWKIGFVLILLGFISAVCLFN
ncbi:MAG TPA: hypothetical protein DIW81_01080 [Planctomycetaceae bacterium]|nr:hypothetical protein [Rubinisphaera sp.]HCS50177.1 hypothetical protein [Planctomycetaceae bacterium]